LAVQRQSVPGLDSGPFYFSPSALVGVVAVVVLNLLVLLDLLRDLSARSIVLVVIIWRIRSGGYISHNRPFQSLHTNPSRVDPATRECV
jgi:hypothetical protein